MDAEKDKIRKYIAQYINVGRERYSDEDMKKLLHIIERKEELNGTSQRYEGLPHESYDHEGRYDRQEIKTYTFVYDQEGIRILLHIDILYDGYKNDEEDKIFDTGRGLINNFPRILRRLYW